MDGFTRVLELRVSELTKSSPQITTVVYFFVGIGTPAPERSRNVGSGSHWSEIAETKYRDSISLLCFFFLRGGYDPSAISNRYSRADLTFDQFE